MSPIAFDRGRTAFEDGAAILVEGEPDRRSEFSRLRLILPETEAENPEQEENSCSSSIGRNSDCSEKSENLDGEEEVQSSPPGALDCNHSLEEALPMRCSITYCYSFHVRSI